jgi:hypothetical protein
VPTECLLFFDVDLIVGLMLEQMIRKFRAYQIGDCYILLLLFSIYVCKYSTNAMLFLTVQCDISM